MSIYLFRTYTYVRNIAEKWLNACKSDADSRAGYCFLSRKRP
jgi:hypothetical protein